MSSVEFHFMKFAPRSLGIIIWLIAVYSIKIEKLYYCVVLSYYNKNLKIMLTDWIIHTKLYDNLKIEKSLDIVKLNNIVDKLIEYQFGNDINELIMNENIEILFENPKICKIFEMIEFNEKKIASIHDKFINLAIRNKFEFDDSYKNENGELYDFYENMLKITCFGKCKDCINAASKGHLECLKYLHENGCYWDDRTCSYAAENGHLECLKYARENGCHWDTYTCSFAVLNDHLVCLKYAHKNGCPWDKYTCQYAAENGHLECLKYAHENGCPWDALTCSAAAQNGHLECFKYAHENGCLWDEYTYMSAAWTGHLKCLKYAHENGCPRDNNWAYCHIVRNGHSECAQYMRNNGCQE
ncbi:ankyrin repeat/4HB MCP domain-containing protein [Bodo saltans virus]|uniref:Ankyrin repeat/4HB MCP domain-containing protein n=1 Tax=Bodo saltans virus TaxID=2024608 RepID=A0A2H4UWD3_9VIRU|nr:ankyrin repeat/4HB MCP domain-containing protein [Bodo saltans virus]ATZ81241.1 ankyrin repeat/4HB MCP domain-containing protein [Bodo saltans virus]